MNDGSLVDTLWVAGCLVFVFEGLMLAAMPAPAPAPMAAPLIVPCCCGVMLVHAAMVVTAAMARIVWTRFMLRLAYLDFGVAGTTISNQTVSSTGRCSLSGFAAYQPSTR